MSTVKKTTKQKRNVTSMREFQAKYFPSRVSTERIRVLRLEKDYGGEIANSVLDGIQGDLEKNISRLRK